jgi:uncharacterized protein (TIGR02246 family)
MGNFRWLALALPLALLGVMAAGAEPADEEVAIIRIETDFDSAWNRHDAGGLVANLADNIDFVTMAGVWVHGRDEYLRLQQNWQRTIFKDSTRTTTEFKVRLTGADSAVLFTKFTVTNIPDANNVNQPTRNGVGIRVLQKHDGRWRVVAEQNGLIAPPSRK